jgi:hypothetical protein
LRDWPIAGLRLDKETEISTQQDDMVRIASRLLDRAFGDAMLHNGYETIWLLRSSGDLTVSEQADLWSNNRLAAITQTYRRATHRFAEYRRSPQRRASARSRTPGAAPAAVERRG